MKNVEGIVRVDEAPEADAMDQQCLVDADDQSGLDTSYVADVADRDANPADLIDQAIVVPVPADD
ncbi:hypothetical protein AWB95_14025 [Mycobacterium celatum]|uniref:Uncharacterized protein n=1 Tax=Mycobacterium celatum TaxID=28045 RepID=A0A1X1RPQ7_MYCCE|nr:hypothetical protein [Mycobacterium celatum]ORV10930.1 hypothetical protein AWB95_14025 [Mycobacterium celatum]PIB79537.1 hypothetical protein CQY23_08170 [Mycobacterium celatum]